jgi:hypothetical protein
MKVDIRARQLYEFCDNHRIKTLLSIFATCAFFPILINIYVGFETRIRAGYLDTAGMMDLVKPENVKVPFNSDYLAGAYGGLISLISSTNETICNVARNINTSSESNIFQDHAYLLSWPLSILNYVLPINSLQIVAAVYLFSYLSVFASTYIFLSKIGVRLSTKISTLFAIATYPVFAVAFTGQPFFDHLMIGFAAPLIYLVWWTKNRSIKVYKWVVVLTMLLTMTTERGASLASLISIGYLVLLHGSNCVKTKELRFILLSGLGSSIWFIIWIKYFQSYGAYGNISFNGIVSRFGALFDSPLSGSVFVFFGTSIFWIILNLLSGRFSLISLFAMSPNLLISIGGAELTGFLTHYHQVYSAALVAGGVIGIAHFDLRITKTKYSVVKKNILSGCCIVFLIASAFVYKINSVEANSGKVWASIQQIWLPNQSSVQESARNRANFLRETLLEIEKYKAVSISAPENFGPALRISGYKNYEYWPTAVGQSTIVIAPFDQDTPIVFPFGDYYGTGTTLAECVSNELKTSYTLFKVVKNDFLGEYRFYLKR